MTDLEKLERARMYMEKLANGINPLDDSKIPEQELINNVHLSRCFFFVADVLRQTIETGGATSQKKTKTKCPFALPMEQRRAFPYSQEPIPISVLTKRINEMIDTKDMAALKYQSITSWLVSVGMLRVLTIDGRHERKLPTPVGNQIGISSEEKIGQNGPYTGIYYNEDAQRFILDHLDAILAFERSSTELQGQPWTPQQDQCLLDLHSKRVSAEEIAITLKRSPQSIHSRLKKLGATP